MLIGISLNDRYEFESAVPSQDIRFIIHNLNSQLVYMLNANNVFTPSLFGAELINRIPMGPDQSYRLPYNLIDFTVCNVYPTQPVIQMLNTQEGFQISIRVGALLSQTHCLLNFDEYMNLTHLSVTFDPWVPNHGAARTEVMNVLYHELPSLLGYLVCCNSRGRSLFTLGEPHDFTVRGEHSSQSVQNLCDVIQITNPRDNPTGITKCPHERAAHDRTLANGEVIRVSPAIVHKDEYQPSNEPKKLKH